MRKVLSGQTISTVDYSTGEVMTEVTSNIVRFPAEPPYVKMYIQDLCAIVGVGDSDQALLRHLLARLDYEGFVALTSRSRESIAYSLGIGTKTLRNRLNRLVNSSLIKPVARNEYKVNPNYFARGDWKRICEQREAYKLTVSYSEKGRTITTESLGDSEKQMDLENFQ